MLAWYENLDVIEIIANGSTTNRNTDSVYKFSHYSAENFKHVTYIAVVVEVLCSIVRSKKRSKNRTTFKERKEKQRGTLK